MYNFFSFDWFHFPINTLISLLHFCIYVIFFFACFPYFSQMYFFVYLHHLEMWRYSFSIQVTDVGITFISNVNLSNFMYLLTPTNISNCFLLQINITVSFINSYVYVYVFFNNPVLVIYVDIFDLILGFLIFLFDHLCTLLTFFCWAIYLLVSFDS